MIDSETSARDFVAARCSSKGFAKLEAFVALLASENSEQNLVSASSLTTAWQRHIADSAQLLDHVSRETWNWLDLGSGAGLPGLVIALMRPTTEVFLIESRKLRIQWLEKAIGTLECPNCSVMGQDLRKVATFEADVISARAFAPLDRLVALSGRFSTSTTRWVLPKGRSAAQEVAALPQHQRAMFHVEQSLTDKDAGIVVGTGKPE